MGIFLSGPTLAASTERKQMHAHKYGSAVVVNVKITFEVEHMKVRFRREAAIEGHHPHKRRWTLVSAIIPVLTAVVFYA